MAPSSTQMYTSTRIGKECRPFSSSAIPSLFHRRFVHFFAHHLLRIVIILKFIVGYLIIIAHKLCLVHHWRLHTLMPDDSLIHALTPCFVAFGFSLSVKIVSKSKLRINYTSLQRIRLSKWFVRKERKEVVRWKMSIIMTEQGGLRLQLGEYAVFFCIMITTNGGGGSSSSSSSKLAPMPPPISTRWKAPCGKRVISSNTLFYSARTMAAGVGERARAGAIASFKVKSRHISSIAHFFADSPQTWSRIERVCVLFYFLAQCVCVLFLSLLILSGRLNRRIIFASGQNSWEFAKLFILRPKINKK